MMWRRIVTGYGTFFFLFQFFLSVFWDLKRVRTEQFFYYYYYFWNVGKVETGGQLPFMVVEISIYRYVIF